MSKNVTLTFTVQTFIEADTDSEFEDKRDEFLEKLEVMGVLVKTPIVECGRYQLATE